MSKLYSLPATCLAPNNADVAKRLHELASAIENGTWGKVHTVTVLLESEGRIHRQLYGHPIDTARLIGLLTMATSQETRG